MSAAASVANLLGLNADINFYTTMQLYWSRLYESNQEKLEQQAKYEQKWEEAQENAIGNSSEKKACHCGCEVVVEKDNQNEELAKAYADAKVWQYDQDLSEKLAELDIEYDTMKTMYDALLEELRAQKDSSKQLATTNLQDTHLLQG